MNKFGNMHAVSTQHGQRREDHPVAQYSKVKGIVGCLTEGAQSSAGLVHQISKEVSKESLLVDREMAQSWEQRKHFKMTIVSSIFFRKNDI